MAEFVFECSDCGQEIEVNGAMRDTILEHGCPVCAADPAESDFVTSVS